MRQWRAAGVGPRPALSPAACANVTAIAQDHRNPDACAACRLSGGASAARGAEAAAGAEGGGRAGRGARGERGVGVLDTRRPVLARLRGHRGGGQLGEALHQEADRVRPVRAGGAPSRTRPARPCSLPADSRPRSRAQSLGQTALLAVLLPLQQNLDAAVRRFQDADAAGGVEGVTHDAEGKPLTPFALVDWDRLKVDAAYNVAKVRAPFQRAPCRRLRIPLTAACCSCAEPAQQDDVQGGADRALAPARRRGLAVQHREDRQGRCRLRGAQVRSGGWRPPERRHGDPLQYARPPPPPQSSRGAAG